MSKYGSNLFCPRCGGGIPSDMMIGQYPGALSRWDNLTEICSACGSEEALLQFYASQSGHDTQLPVDPVNGVKKWVNPPE